MGKEKSPFLYRSPRNSSRVSSSAWFGTKRSQVQILSPRLDLRRLSAESPKSRFQKGIVLIELFMYLSLPRIGVLLMANGSHPPQPKSRPSSSKGSRKPSPKPAK